jgi:hypothetical protein
MSTFGEELFEMEDVSENEKLVLMEATFVPNCDKIVRTSVGVKDEAGDIVRIIEISEKRFKGDELIETTSLEPAPELLDVSGLDGTKPEIPDLTKNLFE